jgi:GAF domain-containing protein
MHGAPPAFVEERRRNPVIQPRPGTMLADALATMRAVQIADLKTEADASSASGTTGGELARLAGARTVLAVPMVKEKDVVGALTLSRQEVRPFTDKQIELVKNFATQAVIAIENARSSDLGEALEQQTATSEVLGVISSSPADLEPVFEAMLDNVVRICDVMGAGICRWDGNVLRHVALRWMNPAFSELLMRTPIHPNPKTNVGRMLTTKKEVHVPDLAAQPAYIEQRKPGIVAAVEIGRVRTALYVPMLRENELVGAILLARGGVRPFTDKQIELVKNFAAQAVIAIENTRLLKELRERTEQVEAQSQELVVLNQQLEQRVADQVGEIERMGRLRRFLPPQVADLIVASGSEKQLEKRSGLSWPSELHSLP